MRRHLAALAAAMLALPACTDTTTAEEDAYYYEDEEPQSDGEFVGDLIGGIVVAIAEGDDDGGGGGRPRPRTVVSRSDLVRDAGSAEEDDHGFVEVRANRLAESLRVRVEGLEPWDQADIRVHDSNGFPFRVGIATADTAGRAAWTVWPGAFSWLGVDSVAGLAGRRIEIYDGAGALMLRGRVPALGRAVRNRAARADWRDAESGVRAVASLWKSGRSGHRQACICVFGVPPGSGAAIAVADASGALVLAGAAEAVADGSLRIRYDSRRGEPLPAGAEDLAGLAGRRFEIRFEGGGVLEGAFPAF